MTAEYAAQEVLTGKTALVTGASGDIGAAAATTLARAGATVILSGRNNEKLERLAARIERATGAEIPIFPADLTDALQVDALVRRAAARSGTLDILLNAAGVGASRSFAALTPEDYQTLLAVNMYGAMLLSQAAVRVMGPQRSGHILHFVGIHGSTPPAEVTACCTSGYDLSGFLAALRAEVGRRYSIKVTALHLDDAETPLYDDPVIKMKVRRGRALSRNAAEDALLCALTRSSRRARGGPSVSPGIHPS